MTIESNGKRVIVAIYCRIDASFMAGSYEEYDEYEDDEDSEDEEEDGEDAREEDAEFVAEYVGLIERVFSAIDFIACKGYNMVRMLL